MKPLIQPALALAFGLLTASLALAGPPPRVYIPTGEGAVQIINTATQQTVGRIAGLPAAHGLAATPDGSRLIVGSFEERAPDAAMPDKPAGVSATDHSAHHAMGTNAETPDALSTVSIVDAATQAILRRIDVPGAVHHVAVSPDGRTAVVTQPGADSITAFDLQSYAVLATVRVGAVPNYAAFAADGATLFVSLAGDDAIVTLDTARWQVTGQIATGASPEHLVLAPDGQRLYVANVGDGTVSVLDPASGQAVATLAVGPKLHGIDLSEDGRTLFVAVRGGHRLIAIDLSDQTRREAALAPAPYHLRAIPGTGRLFVSSSDAPKLWVIDAATLGVVGEIALDGTGHQFAFAASR